MLILLQALADRWGFLELLILCSCQGNFKSSELDDFKKHRGHSKGTLPLRGMCSITLSSLGLLFLFYFVGFKDQKPEISWKG